MCTTKYVVSRIMLGGREIGWELWNGKEVVEMTSKEIKSALLKNEPIYGLEIGADGELTLGSDFFTRNIMEHRHVDNFRPMFEDDNKPSTYYIVLGKTEDGQYEMISTRFRRMTFSEEHLKAVFSLGAVSAGMKMEDGKIVIPEIRREDPIEQLKKEFREEDAKKKGAGKEVKKQ